MKKAGHTATKKPSDKERGEAANAYKKPLKPRGGKSGAASKVRHISLDSPEGKKIIEGTKR
jgi:hypothetical protein